MIRRIITPKKKTFQLDIPESFIGKKIELIAFELTEVIQEKADEAMTVELLNKKFEGLTFDSKGQYVFSRDESTDYE